VGHGESDVEAEVTRLTAAAGVNVGHAESAGTPTIDGPRDPADHSDSDVDRPVGMAYTGALWFSPERCIGGLYC
jgi:hypothetical protein